MLNELIIEGRLTRAAEMRTTKTGAKLLTCGLVWSRPGKAGNEVRTFVDLVGPESMEKVVPYLTKGKHVLAVGEATLRTWEKDGKTNSSFQLALREIHFLDPKPKENSTDIDVEG